MKEARKIDDVNHEWAAFTSISRETGNSYSASEFSLNSIPVLKLVDDLVKGKFEVEGKFLRVDASRLYITGHSMGGLGTWDLIAREPNKWAAAIPMAGYPDHAKAGALVDMPIWAFHHINDSYNSFKGSKTMYDLIRAKPNNGTKIRLKELNFDTKGSGAQAHFRTPKAAWNDESEILIWLFSQVK